jgi:hypothetical protein
MDFQSVGRPGGYCLKLVSTGCEAPYKIPTPSRASLSGAAAAKYCGINEAVTTCEAVLALTKSATCTLDDECGAAGLDDGRCETVGVDANHCTYSCSSDVTCPSDFPCGTTSGNKYCGGPTP